MSTEHPKPLSFEEWFKDTWLAPDVDIQKLDSSTLVGKMLPDMRECWNAARRGLAGPPELVWEVAGGRIGSNYRLEAKTLLGIFYMNIQEHYDSFWQFEPYAPSFVLEACRGNKFDKKEQGRRQAQAHFESLWWSMSKPA